MTLATAFQTLGHEVVVHARRADEALARSLGVQLDVVPVPDFPRFLRDFRFFRRTESVRREARGIIITLTRVRSRHAVICGGTHRGYLAATKKLRGPWDWLQAWMEAESYRSASTIISHSKLCTNELLRWYSVPSDKITTLYPPVDADFVPAVDAAQRATARGRFGLPPDKVVFLFPSTGHRRKGLYSICRALENLNDDVVVAVVGRPPQGMDWPFLRYLGYVEDMPAAYQAADFTLLGSFYEPFGLVGVESILCGTRLVFEEKIGCLETVKPDAVLPFSVRNPDSIRRAISAAVELAKQGRQWLSAPRDALSYNPSATQHARLVLEAVAARQAVKR